MTRGAHAPRTPPTPLPRAPATTRRGRVGRRSGWLDHLIQARDRYTRRQGDLLAAGVTYFAFLGLFPLLLVAVSVAGLVLSGHAQLEEQLFEAIRKAIPGPTGDQLVAQLTQAVDAATITGLVGLVGALYAGLRTVDKLRIGMQRIWNGKVAPPRLIHDNLADLAALGVLGVLGLAGLAVTAAVSQGTTTLVRLLGWDDVPASGILAWVLGIAMAVAGDVVIFLWLLRVVPSLPYRLRQLLPGALFGAAGLEVLKLLGGWYLALISHSLTATAFGGAVGILVWINLVSRLTFFTASWTATLPTIRGRDGSPSTQPS